MTNDVQESYASLLTSISEHENWEYSDSNSYSIEELAVRSADDIGPEAIYDSAETDGQVIIGPGNQSNLIGALIQPLADLDMNPENDRFAARVAEAYESISASHIEDSEYLTQSSLERNPSDVMSLNIPADPDVEELDNALDAASEASQEVQELHNEINQALTSKIDS